MKIAYITSYDANDLSKFSGLGYYICEALVDNGIEIEKIGNLHENFHYFSAIKDRIFNRLKKKRYLRDREGFLARGYAKQVQKKLKDIDVDIVFSPGSIPIAYLDSEKPIAFWADSNFGGMHNNYPEFSNLCNQTLKSGNKIEGDALNNCDLAIYSSDWAAKSAIENYNVDPHKVKVVPFGANLICNRELNDIENMLKSRSRSKCQLLFVGVDWHRKGGDIALKVAIRLNQMGIETELKIVGCQPPHAKRLPEFVKLEGFISKNTKDGTGKLNNLFANSHFFIMPSRFEAFGVVFCEASSFGVPSIATTVGGIPTAVKDGVNGKLYSLNSDIEEYCFFIAECFSNYNNYKALALSSFSEYQSRLNWSVSGLKVKNLLKSIMK